MSSGKKQYGLFPKSERTVKIPFVMLPGKLAGEINGLWRKNTGKAACFTAAGAALGIILGIVLDRAPEGYVVPRFYTDGLEETSDYLESEEDPAYEGWRDMNYRDGQTPM